VDEDHKESASPIDEDGENDDLVLPKSEFSPGYHIPRAFVVLSSTTAARIQTPPGSFQAEVHRLNVS